MLTLLKRISFTVLGPPHGKERPRFGRGGRVFTPPKTVAYERLIAQAASSAMRAQRVPMLDGPLSVEIAIYCQIPASWPKYKKALAIDESMPCLSKPDADNLAKATLDALNKILYDDDSAVVRLVVYKLYSANPRVEVELAQLV